MMWGHLSKLLSTAMDVYLDTGQYGTHWSWEELEYRASLYKNCLEKWILKARRTSSSSGNSKYSHSRSPSTDSAIIHDEVVVRLHPPWHFTSAVASHFRRGFSLPPWLLTSAVKNWRCLAVSSLRFAVNCGCLAVGSLCLVVSFVFAVTRYMGLRKRKNIWQKKKPPSPYTLSFMPWGHWYFVCREVIFLPSVFSFCRGVFYFAVSLFLMPWGFFFCCKVFSFAVSLFLFAVRFSLLPWVFFFCREVISFAVTIVDHRTTRLQSLRSQHIA